MDTHPGYSRIVLGAVASIRKFLAAVPGSIKNHLNIEELARISIAALTAGGGFFGVLQAVVTGASTIFLSPGDAALAVALLTVVLEAPPAARAWHARRAGRVGPERPIRGRDAEGSRGGSSPIRSAHPPLRRPSASHGRGADSRKRSDPAEEIEVAPTLWYGRDARPCRADPAPMRGRPDGGGGKNAVATFEKPSQKVPPDLLPVIRASGVLSDRQFEDLRAKVLRGDLPGDPTALAERLVREKVLTEYQARRLLGGKSHGLVVGRYAILDRIGSGSMGRVYKAHHLMMDRVVALKIIAPEIATNERVVARFQREMKLVGRLDHPNVVRAFDADQINKILYIVMEYVPGESLGHRARKGPIPPPEMINYAAQAARGLAHAHEQGIVHRDIKPSNLLLTDDQRIKVLDLGLGVLMEADEHTSFATADGIAVGTIDYMSPEQACGRDVDGRSDLFSLGCAMYHLMSGRMPFPGETPIDRLGRRIGGKPVPITDVMPDLPPSLVEVMDRLMAHKPSDRYQDANEAAEALEALLRPRSKPAAPSQRKAGSDVAPSPVAAEAPASPTDAYSVVTVRPDYPAWFRPMAELAERNAVAALLAVLGGLAITFGLGFATGLILK